MVIKKRDSPEILANLQHNKVLCEFSRAAETSTGGGSRWWFTWRITGVIRLPIFRRIKHCKCMVILGDVPFNSALFGLVIY